MLPILEYGWSPALWGMLILLSIWMELLFILGLPIQNIKKRTFLVWGVGIVLNGIMMFSTTTGVITIFGLGQADNFIFPALEIVRIVSLGFIDRFDVYGVILMTFGTYIRCSLFFRIAYNETVSSVKRKWLKISVFIVLMFIVVIGTFYLAKEHFRIAGAIKLYAYMILLFPIPFVLLSLSYFRKREK